MPFSPLTRATLFAGSLLSALLLLFPPHGVVGEYSTPSFFSVTQWTKTLTEGAGVSEIKAPANGPIEKRQWSYFAHRFLFSAPHHYTAPSNELLPGRIEILSIGWAHATAQLGALWLCIFAFVILRRRTSEIK